MIDWVWADINDQPELKVRLGKKIGCRLQDIDKKRFKIWAIGNCPELEYCQAIANAVKHTRFDFERQQHTSSGVLPFAATGSVVSTAHINLPNGQPAWVLKIVTKDGQRLKALDIFEEVRGFWRRLIEENPCKGWRRKRSLESLDCPCP
jgi:hypothetical protein